MIFTNIVDVYEFTVNFAGLLENAIEMAEQDPSIVAPIGECFEDMTEVMWAKFPCINNHYESRRIRLMLKTCFRFSRLKRLIATRLI